MSGSGGFYKYRCKYFYTHNCPHWVWVNNAPCTYCMAEGRDDEQQTHTVPHWATTQDIFVPSVHDGILQYTMMELAAPTDPGEKFWTLKEKAAQPPPAMHVTSGMSGPSNYANSRLDMARSKGDHS